MPLKESPSAPTSKKKKTAKALGLKRSELEELSELQLIMACSGHRPSSEKSTTTTTTQLKKRKINTNNNKNNIAKTDFNVDEHNTGLNSERLNSPSLDSLSENTVSSSSPKTTRSFKSPSRRRTSPKSDLTSTVASSSCEDASQHSRIKEVTQQSSTTSELNRHTIHDEQQQQQIETNQDVSSNLDSIVSYLEEGESFQFSDTHIALLKIRQEIDTAILSCKHKMKFFFPPIILKHFLFHEDIIPNQTPTQIEKTLNEMIESHEIRRFYIDRKMYKDIFGYVFTEDYISTIKKQHENYLTQLEQQYENSQEDDSRIISGIPYFMYKNQEESRRKMSETMKKQLAQVISNFCANVLPNVTEPFIEKSELVDFLFPDETEEKQNSKHDEVITLLMTIGALTIKDIDSFYFAIPNLSQFMFYIDNGRKEILSILKRKQFKEIMVHSLLQRPLKNTIFNPMFHIRDMIGDGDVSVIDINGQKMIRIR